MSLWLQTGEALLTKGEGDRTALALRFVASKHQDTQRVERFTETF